MSDLPKPLLAAVALLAEVRRLPAHAVNLGITVLTAADKARRDYDELAGRGERVVRELFGGGETEAEVVPAPPAAEDEAAVVIDAVAHVADPLDRRTAEEPFTGYDALSLGALRGELRSLSPEQVTAALDYERGHLARGPFVTLLERRAATLAAE